MLEKELQKTIDLAKEAGKKVLEIYKGDFKEWEKKDKTVATEADIASQEIILKGLKEFGYGILSEETKDNLSRLKKERVWIIDPLDGTSDFVGKTGDFSIMIGLQERGETILGVVFQPTEQKLYFAQKEKGSFLKEKDLKQKRLKVSDCSDISKARFVASRFHFDKKEKDFIQENNIDNTVFKGSTGLKMGLISEGKADIYISFASKTCQWDTCAPEIILREAGGVVTDIKGEKFVYNREELRNLNGILAVGDKGLKKKITEVL
jgi:3'(2'), 5'-bisphosphate nucleotidase